MGPRQWATHGKSDSSPTLSCTVHKAQQGTPNALAWNLDQTPRQSAHTSSRYLVRTKCSVAKVYQLVITAPLFSMRPSCDHGPTTRTGRPFIPLANHKIQVAGKQTNALVTTCHLGELCTTPVFFAFGYLEQPETGSLRVDHDALFVCFNGRFPVMLTFLCVV